MTRNALALFFLVFLLAACNSEKVPSAELADGDDEKEGWVDPTDGDTGHEEGETEPYVDPCDALGYTTIPFFGSCQELHVTCCRCPDASEVMAVYSPGSETPSWRCSQSCYGDEQCPTGFGCYRHTCTQDALLHQGAIYEACTEDSECAQGMACRTVRESQGQISGQRRCTKICDQGQATESCPTGYTCADPFSSGEWGCMINDSLYFKPYGADCQSSFDCSGDEGFCGRLSSCSLPCDLDSDCPSSPESICLFTDDILPSPYCPSTAGLEHKGECTPIALPRRGFERGLGETCESTQTCLEGLSCIALPPSQFPSCSHLCDNDPCPNGFVCFPAGAHSYCAKKLERPASGALGIECLLDSDCLPPRICRDHPMTFSDNCIARYCDDADGDVDP